MDKRKIVRMLLEAEDSAMKAYNEFLQERILQLVMFTME